jgi:hypothetical protein
MAAAPRAFLVPQTVMHRHAGFALALRALGHCLNPHIGGLELQLRHVRVNHHEVLLCEH